MMKLPGKEKMMDKAEMEEPKAPSSARKAPSHGNPGQEKHWDPNAFNEGNLGHAMDELHRQHPIEHDDHGPHHHETHHERHEPHVMPNHGHHHSKKG